MFKNDDKVPCGCFGCRTDSETTETETETPYGDTCLVCSAPMCPRCGYCASNDDANGGKGCYCSIIDAAESVDEPSNKAKAENLMASAAEEYDEYGVTEELKAALAGATTRALLAIADALAPAEIIDASDERYQPISRPSDDEHGVFKRCEAETVALLKWTPFTEPVTLRPEQAVVVWKWAQKAGAA